MHKENYPIAFLFTRTHVKNAIR